MPGTTGTPGMPGSQGAREKESRAAREPGGQPGGTKRATYVNMPLLQPAELGRQIQCLTKSSPSAGPSAGTEVARLRKCLLEISVVE